MATFNQFTWYVLTNALQSENKTLTAANNTQSAFNPNSPSAIYFSPLASNVPLSQQWQIFPVSTSSASAYIMRNRQIGPSAYLTTAITTRKCGGGTCATVPVLAPTINSESLWYFGDWGFSDSLGGASVYNLGNTSNWRLDQMLQGPDTELVNTTDTGGGGQHYFFSAHETFAASDSSSYGAVPTTVTALLAQYTNTGSPAVTSIQSSGAAVGTSSSTSRGPAQATSPAGSTPSQSSSGLSSGAAAGIGVGVAVAVIGIFIAAFFLFRRRKQNRVRGSATNPAEMAHYGDVVKYPDTPSEMSPDSNSSATFSSKGIANRSEMQSVSETSRAELAAHEPVKRIEMPHPSISPQI